MLTGPSERRPQALPLPPPSSHITHPPSSMLPPPAPTGGGGGGGSGGARPSLSARSSTTTSYHPPRGSRHKSTSISDMDDVDADGEVEMAEQEAEAEADGDETLYCMCQQKSYGEMIGCDNNDCQFEWVSLVSSLSRLFYSFPFLEKVPRDVLCSGVCESKADRAVPPQMCRSDDTRSRDLVLSGLCSEERRPRKGEKEQEEIAVVRECSDEGCTLDSCCTIYPNTVMNHIHNMATSSISSTGYDARSCRRTNN